MRHGQGEQQRESFQKGILLQTIRSSIRQERQITHAAPAQQMPHLNPLMLTHHCSVLTCMYTAGTRLMRQSTW